jgi:hypothetical protein
LDGGDDYFRGGGSLGPLADEQLYVALDRDEALQKLLADLDIDDMFDDDSFLDDFDDYNLGYQAGTLDERERVLKLLEEHLGNMDWDDLAKLIKGETDGKHKEKFN